MDFNIEDNLEITKLQLENSHVYKLPPMSSSEGHTLEDFKELIFKGKLKITVKGDYCLIYFIEEDNDKIFLIAVINYDINKIVTSVVGSTRYFTIKAMTIEKKLGIYGLAFKQRNDAFDFYNTLIDYRDKLKFEKNLAIDINNENYQKKYTFNGFNDINIKNTKDKINKNEDNLNIKK